MARAGKREWPRQAGLLLARGRPRGPASHCHASLPPGVRGESREGRHSHTDCVPTIGGFAATWGTQENTGGRGAGDREAGGLGPARRAP